MSLSDVSRFAHTSRGSHYHRIFAAETLLDWLLDDWEIKRCAVIDDDARIQQGSSIDLLQCFHGQAGVGIITARKAINHHAI